MKDKPKLLRYRAAILDNGGPDRLVWPPDFGQDWVVAKGRTAYLIAQETSAGAVVSGYDQEGRLVADTFRPRWTEVWNWLSEASDRGWVGPLQPLEQDAAGSGPLPP